MNKVFSYELSTAIKKRSFLWSTIFIVLMILAVSFAPRFISLSDPFSLNPNLSIDLDQLRFEDSVLYIEDPQIDREYLQALMGIGDDQVLSSRQELMGLVENKRADKGFIVIDEDEFQVVVKDKEYLKDNTNDFRAILSKYIFDKNLMDLSINPTVVEDSTRENIRSEELILGRDLSKNFILAVVYISILYLLILFYGNGISNTLAREKADRTMELLITATKPSSIVFGKVFSAGVLGVIQFVVFILAGGLGIFINQNFYPAGIFSFLQSLWNLEFTMVFLGFIVLGYLLYLFIFAASGARVNRMEEINIVTLPIIIMFLVILFLTIRSLLNPDGLMMKILSYLPFSSPMAMPVRFSLTQVSLEELGISLGILLVTLLLTMVGSVALYRRSMRNYGSVN